MTDPLPLIRRTAVSVVKTALDLLYPPVCVGCRGEGSFLCPRCEAGLPRLAPPLCRWCAEPVTRPGACRACTMQPLRLDGIVAVYGLDGPARDAVHALKYRRWRALGEPMGALVAGAVRAGRVGPDVVVPIPLHPRRLRERGYNQATLLAGPVGRSLGAPVVDGLRRERRAAAQVGAGREGRAANVAGAFTATTRFDGERVLLVDDVCTTGATLQAAADAARDAGAGSVWGAVFARET